MEKEAGMEQSNPQPERRQYPALVRSAIALMETEYAYLYGIDELADRLEVSKHHLIRVFSVSVGISPGNYLSDLRVAHAKRLLRSPEKTPLEIIAGVCGYSCGNYFAKAFKKRTGLTPTEYARSAREDDPSASLEATEVSDAPADGLTGKFYL
jgi:transcriptional regulator GlxA family with amidase domain